MRALTKHRHVIYSLGRRIINGTWATHQPIEPDTLTDQYGVGRSLMREAIRVLEDKGLIDSRSGAGTRIRPVADWHLLDLDLARWISTSPEHSELRVHAKEAADALAGLVAELPDNPYLDQALAAVQAATRSEALDQMLTDVLAETESAAA